jgi:ribonuclease H / adenosylcobalamin/alpha-ribazole phosphatase
MTATRLHLVRHGAHDELGLALTGRGTIGLNATGRAQTRAAARKLAPEGIAILYSSPVARALETAAILAGPLGLPVTPEEALAELDFGTWEGAAFDQLEGDPQWADWNSDRGRRAAPGGETMVEVQARTGRWLDTLSRSGVPACAAVSHADVIKAIVAHVIGLPLHLHDRIDVAPGSVSTLLLAGWGMRLLSLNERPDGRP